MHPTRDTRPLINLNRAGGRVMPGVMLLLYWRGSEGRKPEVAMPGFICTLHGNTFMSVVCPHIEQGITSGSLPAKIIRMDVDYGNLAGDPRMPMAFPNVYCPVCAEHYGYLSENTRVTGEEFEPLPEMRLIPVCSDCFREARDRQGVTIGAATPANGSVIPGGEA